MKFIAGTALVVIGGAMVIGSATAGFVFGCMLMQWSNDQDEKDAAEPVEGAAT